MVIGRMSALVFFNGSGISPRERMDAEKSYLRSIMFAIDDAAALGAFCFVSFDYFVFFLSSLRIISIIHLFVLLLASIRITLLLV